MACYAVKTDRMDITLDLSRCCIFVQQKWRYNWIDESGRNPWTLQEKRDFHNRADKWIWEMWSSKAYAMITGNSKLAQEYRNTKFKINVDIRWVVGREDEHWSVDVRKIPKGDFSKSAVLWHQRKIILDTEDLNYRVATDPYLQVPVTHEFGHTIGNPPQRNNDGDEYMQWSAYSTDIGSIMHSGTVVKDRHYDHLKQHIDRLISGVTFIIRLY
jgi:hypothetical protein